MRPQPIPFDNSYQTLPEQFYHRQSPAPVPAPSALLVNDALAQQLGIDLDWLQSEEGLAVLAGNAIAPGSQAIATVYAGHQFGHYNPQLGDGRALLLGEVVDRHGQRRDIQLKGSGRTPYSRGGDGKSPLGPVIREYLISEAMHRMRVPTTRALAAVASGEQVFREQGGLPGGILCRIASSHIRVGTVQYFAAQGDHEALKTLLDHVVQRHFPHCRDSAAPYEALFAAVLTGQAELIARWQALGFIHGVMNTDNMLLCGETIDYGPCAFMEDYHPGTVFSSIDQQGRYAYGNQPAIAQWNLLQLAQAMLPLLQGDGEADLKPAVERVQTVLNQFPEHYISAYRRRMADKLGLDDCSDADEQLYRDFLELLQEQHCDFTLSFRKLYDLANQALPINQRGEAIDSLFEFPDAFAPWLQRWQQRLSEDNQNAEQRAAQMRQANPVFMPRNHLVEAAISAAYQGDMSVFTDLNTVLEIPFDYRQQLAHYASPASEEEQVRATFCGT